MAKKKKIKIASPIKSLRMQERLYRKDLAKLGKSLAKAVAIEVLPYIKANEETYTLDGVGSNLEIIFNKLNARFSGVISAGFAQSTATKMVTKTTKANKKKFDKSIERATGVDLGSVIATEGLVDFMETSVNRNVSLISSLPEEYLKSVETIVTNGITSGSKYSTIAKQIVARVGSANSHLAGRINTIAMNEVQTINSQLTLRRSSSLGITRGIYRTAKDEKVRPSHKEIDGDEFVLAKGAYSSIAKKYIQPGITDINCRCDYSPIIDLDDDDDKVAVLAQQSKPSPYKGVLKPIKKPRPKKVKVKTPSPPQPRYIEQQYLSQINSKIGKVASGYVVEEKTNVEVANKIGKVFHEMMNDRPNLKKSFNTFESNFFAPEIRVAPASGEFDYVNKFGGVHTSVDNENAFYDRVSNVIVIRAKHLTVPDVINEKGSWSVASSFESSLRHEVGHSHYISLPIKTQLEFDKLFLSMTEEEVTDSISEYGSSSPSEFFAESFDMFTHPDRETARKRLPKKLNKLMEKHFGGSK